MTKPDLSQITEYLYVSDWPQQAHVDEIKRRNVRLVLCMHWRKPISTIGKPPLELLWLPTIDSPLAPMPISKLVKGAQAALAIINEGGGVLVHCRAGVHRSVAMACCILVGMDYSIDEAMQLVKSQRPVADPYVGYIQSRIRKFAKTWQERNLK